MSSRSLSTALALPASAAALRQLVQLHGVALLLEVSADLLEGGYATGAPGWWRRRAVWW